MKILIENENQMIIGGVDYAKLFTPIFFSAIGIIFILNSKLFTNTSSNYIEYYGLFFILVSAIPYIIKSRRTTVVIDKLYKKVSITHKSLFGKQNYEIEISSIKEILMANKPNFRGKTSYHVSLILNNGQEIDLTPTGCKSYSFLKIIEIIPDVKKCERISSYLNVPFRKLTLRSILSNTIENIKEASSKGTEEEKMKTITEMTNKGIYNRD